MFGPADFQEATNVSRETLDKFRIYADLLDQWRKKINLIGPGTEKDVWQRHFLDSAQLLPLVQAAHPDDKERSWLDIGTGAGFPGLVLSLLGESPVYLVEPNSKKCAFLRTVIRETGAKAEVIQGKVEEISPFQVGFVTSRALAEVSQIVEWGLPFLKSDGEIWLLKGEKAQQELTSAKKTINMSTEIFPSRTDPKGHILRLRDFSMAGAA